MGTEINFYHFLWVEGCFPVKGDIGMGLNGFTCTYVFYMVSNFLIDYFGVK